MSDWQPNDLALCVHIQDDGFGVPANLRTGGVYTVERVFRGVGYLGIWETGLALEGVKPMTARAIGFAAQNFRKIEPHTPDEEDAETIRLLNGQPVPAEV